MIRFWKTLALIACATSTCSIFIDTNLLGIEPVCSIGSKCVPHIQCPKHVRANQPNLTPGCDLGNGVLGVCCQQKNQALATNGSEMLQMAVGPQNDIRPLINEAKHRYAMLMASEPDVESVRVQKGQPEDFHNAVFKSNAIDEITNNHIAMEQVLASQMLQQSQPMSEEPDEFSSLMGSLHGTGGGCIENTPCQYQGKYRTEDGTCNNQYKSLWGSAGYPMEKLLPPAYDDGVWAPRLHAKDRSLLPSPRIISLVLCPDVHRPHPKYNLMVMQFGQLVAHDVTQSSSIKLKDGADVQCCTKDGSGPLPKNVRHFGCLPVPVPTNDPFFKKFGQRCINFVRSALGPNPNCKLGYGRQLTKVTHFLDASVIYGSSKKVFAEVRSFVDGKLRSFNDNGREHLPLTEEQDACLFMEHGNACFFAGDVRVNQIISVTSLHVVFLREHNSIAGDLKELNPHWDDEVLFQETRRIVTAVFQHIVYNEYLPAILGMQLMEKFELHPLKVGWSKSYDPYVNPSITNEFSGAAFRFGHSSVDGRFHIPQHGMINIPDVMFNPGKLRLDYFHDAMIQTLTNQPMQRVDSSISKSLTQHLFQGTKPFGLDLVALNIQRGRDHGIRPYNDYLHLTGSKPVDSFADFGFETGRKLNTVYRHPHDVDLFVGGIIEQTPEDAVVGATFGEIIADQFSKFKKGDRYFYENGADVNPGAFTLAQLRVIRQQSLARLICSNADRIMLFAQSPHALWRPDLPGNEPIDCKSGHYPKIDLTPWKN